MQWSTLFVLVLVVFVASTFGACPGNAACKAFGQSCTSSFDCAFGLYCNGGTCQNTKGQASACTSDFECSNGYSCISEPNPCSKGTATPKWLEGKPMNEWFNIPNTQGAGGSFVDTFSGFAYNELTNEIFIAAAGGHHDSYDNRVVSMALNVDNPQWVIRMPASTNYTEDVAYYPDGKPTSRHTYRQMFFVPQINRLMLFGNIGAWGNGYSFTNSDGFNPSTNTWDPAGTYPSSAYYVGGAMIRATGEVFSIFGYIWSPQYNNWSLPTFNQIESMRFPIAYDSLRNQFYNLQIGDGQGFDGPKVHSTRIPVKGTVQYNVTFTPSDAYNMFVAENPVYAAMDYDVDNDRFLFYSGIETAAGRVYVITPNNGNNWDISLFQYGPNSIPVTPVLGNGINGRFRYIPAYKGFLLLPRNTDNLFFMRTSNATCTSGADQRICLPISNGPGMPCTQDGDCYILNSTISSRQKSTCLNTKKCYGLAQSAGCEAYDQCNVGLVCKDSKCSSLAAAGQACASQLECQFGLSCLKTSKDSSTTSCVAYGQGTSGSYCEDSSFCGDNLYCDSTSKTCTSSTSSANCPNPVGFNQAVTSLITCYQSNPVCKGAVPCSSCSSQICSLYAIAPQFMRTLCTDSPAKKDALNACPNQPATTSSTTGASSSKTTTTSSGATSAAGSSTSGAPKTTTTTSGVSSTSSSPLPSSTTTTTSSPIDSAAVLVTAPIVVVLLAVLLLL